MVIPSSSGATVVGQTPNPGTTVRREGPARHQIKVGTPLMGGILFTTVTSVLTIVFNLVNLIHGECFISFILNDCIFDFDSCFAFGYHWFIFRQQAFFGHVMHRDSIV